VLWAGLSDPRGAFAALVSALDDLLAARFEPEKREFTPHLTLARLNPPQDLRKVAAELLDVRAGGGEFVVDALVLYRSHLSPRGARYEALERFPLGAG
jgi:2'-5' RNA ligase